MIKTIDIFLIFLTLGIFLWGTRKRIRLWSVGVAEDRSGSTWIRIKSLIVEGIFHKRILQDRYPGFLHLFVFFGFLLPLSVVILTQIMFSLPSFLAGPLSLVLDLLALLALVSMILFIYRRYVTRPPRLDNRSEDLIVLLLILAILLTGLLLESLRLSVVGPDVLARAPVGRAISGLLQLLGLSLSGAFLLGRDVFLIAFFYLILQIAYTYYLKHVVILDVFVIAAGFILRVAAGGLAIDVAISHWLLICTLLLALFLAMSKRRHELILLEEDASRHRPILQEYSPSK